MTTSPASSALRDGARSGFRGGGRSVLGWLAFIPWALDFEDAEKEAQFREWYFRKYRVSVCTPPHELQRLSLRVQCIMPDSKIRDSRNFKRGDLKAEVNERKLTTPAEQIIFPMIGAMMYGHIRLGLDLATMLSSTGCPPPLLL
jgi:hypothetical protein